MQHPLAIAIYSDSSSYDERVRYCASMTNRDYRAYLLKRVNLQVASERREFGTRYKQSDIDTAVSELHSAISEHVRDTKITRAADADSAAGVKAIIYLQSLVGITETAAQAEHGWAGMREHERAATLRMYRLLCA